jgi:predicted phage tail protein
MGKIEATDKKKLDGTNYFIRSPQATKKTKKTDSSKKNRFFMDLDNMQSAKENY